MNQWITRAGVKAGPVLESVAGNWANRDPDAAYAWASSLPEGPMRGIAMKEVIAETGRLDQQRALEMAVSLAEGPERDGVLQTLVSQSGEADKLAAAVQIQDPSTRREALLMSLRRWMYEDPAATSALLQPDAASPISPEDRAALRLLIPSQ